MTMDSCDNRLGGNSGHKHLFYASNTSAFFCFKNENQIGVVMALKCFGRAPHIVLFRTSSLNFIPWTGVYVL